MPDSLDMPGVGFKVAQLQEWATTFEAEKVLGYSGNQGVHDLLFNQRAFLPCDVAYVPTRHQPLYLIRRSALLALKRERDALAAAKPPPERDRRQLRKRVRELIGAPVSGGRRLNAAHLSKLRELAGRPVGGFGELSSDELRHILDHARHSRE